MDNHAATPCSNWWHRKITLGSRKNFSETFSKFHKITDSQTDGFKKLQTLHAIAPLFTSVIFRLFSKGSDSVSAVPNITHNTAFTVELNTRLLLKSGRHFAHCNQN